MKKEWFKIVALIFIATACSSSQYGSRVKSPFSGNAYESNKRFFRAIGSAQSSSENIARSKADMDARTILAGQVNTTIKQVADNYAAQTNNEVGADVAEKFQSLSRAVMNTDMADVRKIGEKKFYNAKEKKYTVFIAYEIQKRNMFRFMKKQARTEKKIDERQMNIINKILDEQINMSEE